MREGGRAGGVRQVQLCWGTGGGQRRTGRRRAGQEGRGKRMLVCLGGSIHPIQQHEQAAPAILSTLLGCNHAWLTDCPIVLVLQTTISTSVPPAAAAAAAASAGPERLRLVACLSPLHNPQPRYPHPAPAAASPMPHTYSPLPTLTPERLQPLLRREHPLPATCATCGSPTQTPWSWFRSTLLDLPHPPAWALAAAAGRR